MRVRVRVTKIKTGVQLKSTAGLNNILSIFSGFYTVSPQKQSKMFLPQLCQISTNFDNFWHEDGQDDIIMYSALTYHLT